MQGALALMSVRGIQIPEVVVDTAYRLGGLVYGLLRSDGWLANLRLLPCPLCLRGIARDGYDGRRRWAVTPDFLICLECESPVYVFEWENDRLVEAVCTMCGNEEVSEFATEAELEELSADRRWWPSKT